MKTFLSTTFIIFFISAVSCSRLNAQCRTVAWTDSMNHSIYCNCLVTVYNQYHSFMQVTDAHRIYTAGVKNYGYPDPYAFVRKYDAQGTLLWMVQPLTAFNSAGGLGLDSLNNAYVSVLQQYGVTTFYLTSTMSAPGSPQKKNYLFKVSSNGTPLWLVNTYGYRSAMDRWANTYVAGNQDTLEKFDSDGNLVWRKAITPDITPVTKIKTDHDGNVIITDGNYVIKFDSTGQQLWKVRPSFMVHYSFGVSDIAVNSSNEIFLAGYNEIIKITSPANYSLLTTWGWPYGNPQLFMDKNDNLIVAFAGGRYIWYLDQSGAIAENFTYIDNSYYNRTFLYAEENKYFFNAAWDTSYTQTDPTHWRSKAWSALTKYHYNVSHTIAPVTASRLCLGDTIILQCIDTGLHTYQWYKDNTLIPGATNAQLLIDTVGEADYYCIVNGNAVCPTNIITAAIEVPLTTPPSLNIQFNACGYTWLHSSDGDNTIWHNLYFNGVLISSTHQFSFYATTDGYYTVTDSNSCGVIPSNDTIWVDVHEIPQSGLQSPYHICDGQSIVLAADPGFTYYKWFINGFSLLNDSITIDSTVTGLGLQIKDSMNCVANEFIDIYEHPLPAPEITGDTLFCNGDSVQLHSGTGYMQYNWSTGETTETIVIYSGQTVFVNVTDSFGCSNADTLTIHEIIIPAPSITFDSVNCALYSSAIAGALYQWYFNDSIIAGATNDTLLGMSPGNYSLQIFSDSCSVFSDTLTVNCSLTEISETSFSTSIFVSNPVSEYLFVSVTSPAQPEDFIIIIYDAIGRIVHASTLDNKGKTFINIKNLPQGVYYYRISSQKKTVCNGKVIKL